MGTGQVGVTRGGHTAGMTSFRPHSLMALTVALAAVSSSGPAQAAPTLSAQSIIVNPVTSELNVKVWTDRDSSGAGTPAYAPGEKIRLYTSVTQDAYVYLFNVDPQGQVDLILPNRYQGGANFLKANVVKAFPSAGDPFSFDIAAPYGVNKVLAVASRTPLNLDQIATFKSEQNSFASVKVTGQQGLAQALSIVVTPLPQNTWVSDTAFYTVAGRAVSAPQPVRPTPAPVVVNPWGTQREWRISVDNRTDLRAQHDAYAAKLRAEGYVLVGTRVKNNEIESEFRRAGGGKAELKVKRKGNRTEITVERR
ncbi:S-layer protein [Deinococcus indicus]|nr:S-layer protein [Deinococcus indicus]